jgi:hypothetical protein
MALLMAGIFLLGVSWVDAEASPSPPQAKKMFGARLDLIKSEGRAQK